MNDIATDLADLERRVRALETKVASLPDAKQIDERIQANLPPSADPSQAPSLKDLSLPIPSVDAIVSTAKTTWTLFAMFNELKMLFWTLFDRRYHMAWLTRVIAIVLLVLIVTSHWWLPLAFDNVIGHTWEKAVDLMLAFVMFFVLHFEMRRYQEWRSKR